MGSRVSNIRFIDHLLQAGISGHEQDGTRRTALHYVASSSEDAASSDMDSRCVQWPTRSGAFITMSTKKVETVLQPLVGPRHAALDPRLSRLYATLAHLVELLEDDK